ncbi:MAG: hypothetical protein HY815_30545, partial [Candidatus Riflebacteria bacterium]|nr:hypothetical protein [Candidatus Riflebacteria bacterium]
MTKSLSFVVLLACALACAPMATAQVDHNLSNQVGEAANAAGAAFVVGA